jgi:hypothetical protein
VAGGWASPEGARTRTDLGEDVMSHASYCRVCRKGCISWRDGVRRAWGQVDQREAVGGGGKAKGTSKG